MTWSTPKTTWQANEIVNESDMNAIGDNLVALKDPATSIYTRKGTTDYTISSTSFVDVDATNLDLSITTTGGAVLLTFSCAAFASGVASLFFDVLVDSSVLVGGTDGLVAASVSSTLISTFSFSHWVTGLSAATHTFKLQAKVNAAVTATIFAGGTAGVATAVQFAAREVS